MKPSNWNKYFVYLLLKCLIWYKFQMHMNT